MRREQKITIDGKKIVVRELTAQDILAYYETDEGINILAGFLYGDLERVADVMEKCTGLSREQINEMGATDFARLLSVLREVHVDFLPILREELARSRKVETESPSQNSPAG